MIRRVRIRGFQPYIDATMNLVDGVTAVVGATNSGKSAGVRGIFWTNFNRPSGERFVNPNAAVCSVEIETDRGTVIRTRKPENSYIINGVKYTSFGRAVPEEMKTVLNLDDVNFQVQFEPYFLVLQSPGAISQYISETLGFRVADDAVKEAKVSIDRLKESITTLTGKVERADVSLKPFEYVDATNDELVYVESTLERVENHEKTVQQIEELVREIGNLQVQQQRWKLLVEQSSLVEAEKRLSQLEQVHTLRTSLQTTIDDATATIKHHGACQATLLVPPVAESTFRQLETSYTTLQSLQNALNTLRNASDSVIAGKAEYITSVAMVNTAKHEYAEELKTYKLCPYCKTPVGPDIIDHVIKEL